MRKMAAWLIGMTVCGAGICEDSVSVHCRKDSDCRSLGEDFRCVAQKTGCPDNPSMSTCASSACIRVAPPSTTPAVADGLNPIQDKHRYCLKDDDCAVVLIGCHCMYCARPDDAQNGWVQAVHKRFAKQFQRLSHCSDADLKKCATAGACAVTGESLPACVKRRCAVVYKPRG